MHNCDADTEYFGDFDRLAKEVMLRFKIPFRGLFKKAPYVPYLLSRNISQNTN